MYKRQADDEFVLQKSQERSDLWLLTEESAHEASELEAPWEKKVLVATQGWEKSPRFGKVGYLPKEAF